ncbi:MULTISPECIES: type I methionyl aminopeptidase [Pseudomonadaceae]|uniref:Methionine aminopeptidase n=1 Tax=Metapseudomonas otitidis TaxID=319939 RepID=A0A6S5RSD0_9GAMM|nr:MULTISPECIES: type I methionyl aminopeptidase [Pseudomonas]MDL5591556.1 type I methionyl aminopeptidase [Bacillus subtilis]KIV67966.1 Methionine aminopeptidase [Pseudomonas sp. FeS53a]MDG9781448.1 type I methionyl aminopeptidase [Pseudomonas otitidis]MDH0334543.1 type I methionyl aminopeptidase [Pseudomonas otitidis]MDH1107268.1 type I methionyl aminopeptidase [Pseudomonas otitidis]
MSKVTIKTADEIARMAVAGRLAARVLEALEAFIVPGITTMDIDAFCERYIVETLDAIPGSKGQYGYPYTVNTSVNHVVCHGWPSASEVLKEGDIVNVDVTVIKNGYYGDTSRMYAVGRISEDAKRLVRVTRECLYDAIRVVRPGATLGDVGHAIQTHAERMGYSVVLEFCGHGIGRQMHESPQVLHVGRPGQGLRLEPGMTFTIEPMINQGRRQVRTLADGWTVITRDGSLSAQFEHTVLVTETGFRVLTLREEEREAFPADPVLPA